MRTISASELPVLVGLVSGMPAFNDFRAAYTRLTMGKGCCGKGGHHPLTPNELSALAAHFKIGAAKAGHPKVYSVLAALYSAKGDLTVSLTAGNETILRANGDAHNRTTG